MGKTLNIGIAGFGGMGTGHGWALSGRGDYTGEDGYSSYNAGQKKLSDLSAKLRLRGVYDIDQARMDWAGANGFGTYESFRSMLDDAELDIVLIATPNHLHKEMAIASFRAGKHVLCEKPVMTHSRELTEVLAVAEETGRIFYPRQNRRWDRDYLVAKKLYDEATLGKLFRIECRMSGSRGIPGDWRMHKEFGGGMMLDWGVHLLDRLLCMVPEKITKVFCQMTHARYDEVDDGCYLLIAFESGLSAVVEVGTCLFIDKPLWYLAGTHGSALIRNWDCQGELALLENWEDKDVAPILAGEGLTKTMAPRTDGTVSHLPLPDVTVDRDALYMNLADVIHGDAEPLITGSQALRVLRLMEAAFESDQTGSAVSFET